MTASTMAQSVVVSRVGLSTLRTRIGRALILVISMACATGVLLSMLSLSDGLKRAYESGGGERLTIVTSPQSDIEQFSALSRDWVATILDGPGIAKRADGSLLASVEITQWMPPADASSGSGFRLRGIGPNGAVLRPQFRIVAGRMFRAGARELIAGVGARRMTGLNPGDRVIFPNGEWPIVGIFSAGGNFIESEMIGDVDTIMSTMRLPDFNSVLVQLAGPGSFEAFARWLSDNPALTVKAENQTAYYLRSEADTNVRFFKSIAYVISAVLAMGALFGAVKLLYSGVHTRTREIATLRAIGYQAFPVAASVVLESIMLSLAGALLGAFIAWLIFDGRQTWYHQHAFQLSISLQSFLLAAGWAVLLALLGGALPAIRAARLPVVEALRAV